MSTPVVGASDDFRPLRLAREGDRLVELTTERLLLRRFRIGDAPLLGELDSDPEVMRFIDGGGHAPRPDLDREAIERFVRQYVARPGLGFFAAHDRKGGDFLGWFHFRPDRENENDIDLGYRLFRRAWGQGIATEWSRALLARGFGMLGVRRVVARALVANIASWRVMEKLGMLRVEDFIEERFPGSDKRAVKYAITAEE